MPAKAKDKAALKALIRAAGKEEEVKAEALKYKLELSATPTEYPYVIGQLLVVAGHGLGAWEKLEVATDSNAFQKGSASDIKLALSARKQVAWQFELLSKSLLGDRVRHIDADVLKRRGMTFGRLEMSATRIMFGRCRESEHCAKYCSQKHRDLAAAFLEALALFQGGVRARKADAHARKLIGEYLALENYDPHKLEHYKAGARIRTPKKTGGSSSSGASSKRVSAPKGKKPCPKRARTKGEAAPPETGGASSDDEDRELASYPMEVDDVWVECACCGKWRRLRGVTDVASLLSSMWVCEFNKDEDHDTCEAPEEASDNVAWNYSVVLQPDFVTELEGVELRVDPRSETGYRGVSLVGDGGYLATHGAWSTTCPTAEAAALEYARKEDELLQEAQAAAEKEGLTLLTNECAQFGYRWVERSAKGSRLPYSASLRLKGQPKESLGTHATIAEAALAIARRLGPKRIAELHAADAAAAAVAAATADAARWSPDDARKIAEGEELRLLHGTGAGGYRWVYNAAARSTQPYTARPDIDGVQTSLGVHPTPQAAALVIARWLGKDGIAKVDAADAAAAAAAAVAAAAAAAAPKTMEAAEAIARAEGLVSLELLRDRTRPTGFPCITKEKDKKLQAGRYFVVLTAAAVRAAPPGEPRVGEFATLPEAALALARRLGPGFNVAVFEPAAAAAAPTMEEAEEIARAEGLVSLELLRDRTRPTGFPCITKAKEKGSKYIVDLTAAAVRAAPPGERRVGKFATLPEAALALARRLGPGFDVAAFGR